MIRKMCDNCNVQKHLKHCIPHRCTKREPDAMDMLFELFCNGTRLSRDDVAWGNIDCHRGEKVAIVQRGLLINVTRRKNCTCLDG